jgi:prepilin-type processing-associated H-X9-DG protein
MKTSPIQTRSFCGFARVDAVMVLFSLLLLALVAWAAVWVGGEKRQIWVCAHHMKTLGQAFAEFTQAHNGALPPAVVDNGKNSTSWDSEIAVYLQSELTKSNSPRAIKSLETQLSPLFKCPSDREPRHGGLPRSYSMPMYDINLVGWPPDHNSVGGIGLYLNAKTIKKARGADSAESPDYMPVIKTSMVPDPADTALLVERVSSLNVLWATKYACITSTKEQFEAKTPFAAKDFHGGKMNCLMLDGHVELLWPVQSGGHVGAGNEGVWTIKPGD